MWYRNIQIIKDTTDFISDPINWSANSLLIPSQMLAIVLLTLLNMSETIPVRLDQPLEIAFSIVCFRANSACNSIPKIQSSVLIPFQIPLIHEDILFQTL